MPRVFLSHSIKDRAFCERLAEDLKAADIDVWYDGWNLDVGDSLTRKIASGIKEHEYFGIVLSPDALESQWVRFELSTALVLCF